MNIDKMARQRKRMLTRKSTPVNDLRIFWGNERDFKNKVVDILRNFVHSPSKVELLKNGCGLTRSQLSALLDIMIVDHEWGIEVKPKNPLADPIASDYGEQQQQRGDVTTFVDPSPHFEFAGQNYLCSVMFCYQTAKVMIQCIHVGAKLFWQTLLFDWNSVDFELDDGWMNSRMAKAGLCRQEDEAETSESDVSSVDSYFEGVKAVMKDGKAPVWRGDVRGEWHRDWSDEHNRPFYYREDDDGKVIAESKTWLPSSQFAGDTEEVQKYLVRKVLRDKKKAERLLEKEELEQKAAEEAERLAKAEEKKRRKELEKAERARIREDTQLAKQERKAEKRQARKEAKKARKREMRRGNNLERKPDEDKFQSEQQLEPEASEDPEVIDEKIESEGDEKVEIDGDKTIEIESGPEKKQLTVEQQIEEEAARAKYVFEEKVRLGILRPGHGLP